MNERSLLVLVVDDDPTIREALKMRVSAWGYESCAAEDMESAKDVLRERDPDLVVADLVLPDVDDLELLEHLKEDDPDRPVILVTAHGSIDVAVEAMKRGARDFLTKPVDADKLEALLESAAEELELRERARELERELESEEAGLGSLVGRTDAMETVFRAVRLLAENDASAIITGESGTGKEVVARTIHELSDRSDGPFEAVNAAAIPEGLIESELFGHVEGAFTGAKQSRPGYFERADGGTLLLDEISEMPMELQPKLLRIIEEGSVRRVGGDDMIPFEVRVLAATNRSPEEAIEEGRLREDLFYRLNVFEILVPPLRNRRDDIPLLAHHFVRSFNEKHELEVEGIADEAEELLEAYEWPGNVRELRNVIERAVIVTGEGWIGPDDLPPYLDGGDSEQPKVVLPVGVTARQAEKKLILKTLDHVGHNKAEAARQLDLDPKTIRNKLKRWEEEESEDGGS
ncbi:MAG: sigma-54 dependent transcriptional regulator [Candidatus Palauibacterales bacterium]|nr:sigma-54 dependent transcriptional regulator [Candidatus Palauibacterales bacterium]